MIVGPDCLCFGHGVRMLRKLRKSPLRSVAEFATFADNASRSNAEAAEKVRAEHKGTWKNGKHTDQWITTLRTYENPMLGEMVVDQIDTPGRAESLGSDLAHQPRDGETGARADRKRA